MLTFCIDEWGNTDLRSSVGAFAIKKKEKKREKKIKRRREKGERKKEGKIHKLTFNAGIKRELLTRIFGVQLVQDERFSQFPLYYFSDRIFIMLVFCVKRPVNAGALR